MQPSEEPACKRVHGNGNVSQSASKTQAELVRTAVLKQKSVSDSDAISQAPLAPRSFIVPHDTTSVSPARRRLADPQYRALFLQRFLAGILAQYPERLPASIVCELLDDPNSFSVEHLKILKRPFIEKTFEHIEYNKAVGKPYATILQSLSNHILPDDKHISRFNSLVFELFTSNTIDRKCDSQEKQSFLRLAAATLAKPTTSSQVKKKIAHHLITEVSNGTIHDTDAAAYIEPILHLLIAQRRLDPALSKPEVYGLDMGVAEALARCMEKVRLCKDDQAALPCAYRLTAELSVLLSLENMSTEFVAKSGRIAVSMLKALIRGHIPKRHGVELYRQIRDCRYRQQVAAKTPHTEHIIARNLRDLTDLLITNRLSKTGAAVLAEHTENKTKKARKALLTELFPDGISSAHFKQGKIRDCLALAHIRGLIEKAPDVVTGMFAPGPDKSIIITLPGDQIGNAFKRSDVQIDGVSGPLGIRLLETAVGRSMKKLPTLNTAANEASGVQRPSTPFALSRSNHKSLGRRHPFAVDVHFPMYSDNERVSLRARGQSFCSAKRRESAAILTELENILTEKPEDFITIVGMDGHAYFVRNVSDQTITVVDPYDTSVAIEISREEFPYKCHGIVRRPKPHRQRL